MPWKLPAGATLAEVEREHIIRVLRETNGVVSAAATRLGVPRTTLNAMMRKLDDLAQRSLAPTLLEGAES